VGTGGGVGSVVGSGLGEGLGEGGGDGSPDGGADVPGSAEGVGSPAGLAVGVGVGAGLGVAVTGGAEQPPTPDVVAVPSCAGAALKVARGTVPGGGNSLAANAPSSTRSATSV